MLRISAILLAMLLSILAVVNRYQPGAQVLVLEHRGNLYIEVAVMEETRHTATHYPSPKLAEWGGVDKVKH